ncbi:hypothetical protein I7I50_00397 [Histoplasma capsulatum G186AR]|uniref:Uncharacterized protein n=1 Tax=Ajellomyces capsulatus TaxID=5037 RepID=A0A8H7YG33_AJECA|nr:hypothetical protein I7I52_07665 [Histoplasma capsulatum]QSS72529.1 hypothetical protein I7I50_00397 [Histoplasma capsulatum G186AR]
MLRGAGWTLQQHLIRWRIPIMSEVAVFSFIPRLSYLCSIIVCSAGLGFLICRLVMAAHARYARHSDCQSGIPFP